MVSYQIDDRGNYTKLEITKGDKVIVRQKFNTLEECFYWMLNKSKKAETKQMIDELTKMEMFIRDSKFTFKENIIDAEILKNGM